MYYDTGLGEIVCFGSNFDFMRSKSHRPLALLHLRREGFRADGRNEAVISGGTLEVAAPRIVQSQAPVAPRTIRGRVTESRLITPATPPGTAPVDHRNRTANAGSAPGMQFPSQMNPAPIQQGNAGASKPANQTTPGGMRIPSQLKPVPLTPEVEAQKARDLAMALAEKARYYWQTREPGEGRTRDDDGARDR